jgi:hypothetical protein
MFYPLPNLNDSFLLSIKKGRQGQSEDETGESDEIS